uniref:Uncharacterized protein n=1 Tax=Candidatus Kentrum sp. DK TaxID=2126562 RepID=A0A450S2W8_9GAMM|nr:MAG: hypothetical protein BECKDK2373C_GA0170839_101357 [Candidatus Kentron sp. DK]
MPINVSMMGTAPDSSASTTNVPKGAFACLLQGYPVGG